MLPDFESLERLLVSRYPSDEDVEKKQNQIKKKAAKKYNWGSLVREINNVNQDIKFWEGKKCAYIELEFQNFDLDDDLVKFREKRISSIDEEIEFLKNLKKGVSAQMRKFKAQSSHNKTQTQKA